MQTDILVIFSTLPQSAAKEVGETLVREKLAACVNIVPGVISLYEWKGVLEESAEWLLIIKSTRQKYESLRARLLQLHPYEVPEIVALSPEMVHGSYAEWIRSVVDCPTKIS